MKKQILFMMFLSLAFVFAGVNKVNAQIVDGCAEGPFNPLPGGTYSYEVTGSPGGGTFLWYVLDASDGLNLLDNSSPSADATIATNGVNPVSVAWGANAGANGKEYVLVVKYTGPDGCSDNLKAWEIKPQNTFQIEVENILANGDPLSEDICRDVVESATYNDGDPGTITYDYGENSFYLRITAANYANNWTPTVAPSGETAPQSFTVAGYFTSTDFTGTPIGMETATSVDVIYVKIDLDHGAYEGTTAQTLTFAVTAVDGGGNDDVDLNATCTEKEEEDDTVTQTLLGRPSVEPVTGGPEPFIP